MLLMDYLNDATVVLANVSEPRQDDPANAAASMLPSCPLTLLALVLLPFPLEGLADRLDIEIASCDNIIRAFEVRRRMRIQERNALVSHIHKLPIELLKLIFELSLRPGILYYKDLTTLRLVVLCWTRMIDACPSMLIHIHCTDSPSQIIAAMERSQELTLDINLLCLDAPMHQHEAKFHDHGRFSRPFFNRALTPHVLRVALSCGNRSSHLWQQPDCRVCGRSCQARQGSPGLYESRSSCSNSEH